MTDSVGREETTVAVAEALGVEIVAACPLQGGMIGRVMRLDLADGRTIVAKTSQGTDLRVEARMLRTLAEKSPLPVPEVLDASEDLLLLSYLPGATGVGGEAAQRHLAELIAATHEVEGSAFGFDTDTLLGPYRLPNAWMDDGIAFFRDRRLAWSLRLARDAGHLRPDLVARVERIAERLPTMLDRHGLVPVLLHGDLWSGNVLTERDRVTGILDPAVHFDDAETKMAFSDLFGGVGDAFWERYAQSRDLPEAFFAWRRWCWQLVPLLIHVALFGKAYIAPLSRPLEVLERGP